MKPFSMLMFGLGVALTCAALPVLSADRIVTRSQVVSYADLNLSNPEGVRTLYRRIQAAARNVCTQSNDTLHIEHINFRKCMAQAVDEAVTRLNKPELTAMHRSGTPNGPRPAG